MYRMTLDHRPVNSTTQHITWPMPHIESELSEMRNAKAFASINFPSGYWQLTLHLDSQHLLAFLIPDEALQLIRTPKQSGHKCSFKRHGPKRTIQVSSELSYSAGPLRSGKAENEHAARLIMYKSSLQGTDVPRVTLELTNHIESVTKLSNALSIQAKQIIAFSAKFNC